MPVKVGESLNAKPSEMYSVVMTNPPFGKKSSVAAESLEESANLPESDLIAAEIAEDFRPLSTSFLRSLPT